MKKIDLHIHTVPSFSDSHFEFSLDTFKNYVITAKLDAVAVTNHDLFDGAQFHLIQQSLDITVFPGIEINLEKGHVLVLGSPSEVKDFEAKAKLITQKITKKGDTISFETLKEIYGDLSQYVVIPHFDKAPPIDAETFEKLKPYACAGEVDSAKKFVRLIKDKAKPTPVLFSDSRMKVGLERMPTRHTFVDCGTLTIGALNTCLRDKSKVALSESDGNELWAALENGQKISTGLNVLIGARSTGKTYTLDEINSSNENVKYIKQFELVQLDEARSDKEFKSDVEKRRSLVVDGHLAGLKRVIDDVIKLDPINNDRRIDRYFETLFGLTGFLCQVH